MSSEQEPKLYVNLTPFDLLHTRCTHCQKLHIFGFWPQITDAQKRINREGMSVLVTDRCRDCGQEVMQTYNLTHESRKTAALSTPSEPTAQVMKMVPVTLSDVWKLLSSSSSQSKLSRLQKVNLIRLLLTQLTPDDLDQMSREFLEMNGTDLAVFEIIEQAVGKVQLLRDTGQLNRPVKGGVDGVKLWMAAREVQSRVGKDA